ncbi:MAG: hypothetical protein IPN34_17700 [Planctomycetes bacterium]|nr:hypothetical protein [Planctomycetota bacterium]
MSSDSRTLAAWKRLLDACDLLAAALRAREERGGGAAEDGASERRAAALDAARAEELDAAFAPVDSGDVGLADASDRLIVALLVQRHVASKSPSAGVRELLGLLADSTFERLEWTARFRADRPLARSGLVAIDPEREGADPLDASCRLSGDGIRRLLLGSAAAAEDKSEKIADEGELLARLQELTGLYERRASRLFERNDKSPSPAGPESEKLDEKDEARIDALELCFEDLLAESAALPFRSPLLELARKLRLNFEETFLVGYLLLSELIDGDPWQSAARSLCLLADSEVALWDLRRLLEADAPLRKHGLIVLEELIDGRPLSADIGLSTWLVQRLTADAESTIQPDERIDFHLYLKDLGDSESFFRRLDAEKGREEH